MRPGVTGMVVLVAVTPARELVLVEQHRRGPSPGVIELPAGLVGDSRACEAESLDVAAHRELVEETGFEAREMVELAAGPDRRGRLRRGRDVLPGAGPAARRPGRRRRHRGHHRARRAARDARGVPGRQARRGPGWSIPKIFAGLYLVGESEAAVSADRFSARRAARAARLRAARRGRRHGDLGVHGRSRALQPERRASRRRPHGAARHGHGPRRRRARRARRAASTPPRSSTSTSSCPSGAASSARAPR